MRLIQRQQSYMAGLLSKNRTYVPNLKKLEFYTRPDFLRVDYPHSEVDDYLTLNVFVRIRCVNHYDCGYNCKHAR